MEIPTNAFGEYKTYISVEPVKAALLARKSNQPLVYMFDRYSLNRETTEGHFFRLYAIADDLLEVIRLSTGERFVYLITKVPDKLLYLAEWPD